MEPAEEVSPDLLNERIDCFVFFKGGKAYPQSFAWNNKEYAVKKINYSWEEREGQARITYFSVDTGTNLYQISFNNTSFRWQIDKPL